VIGNLFSSLAEKLRMLDEHVPVHAQPFSVFAEHAAPSRTYIREFAEDDAVHGEIFNKLAEKFCMCRTFVSKLAENSGRGGIARSALRHIRGDWGQAFVLRLITEKRRIGLLARADKSLRISN
jgi:hypothetical protein